MLVTLFEVQRFISHFAKEKPEYSSVKSIFRNRLSFSICSLLKKGIFVHASKENHLTKKVGRVEQNLMNDIVYFHSFTIRYR